MNSKRLLLLVAAILAEVAATLMLRASVSDPVWIPGVVVLYATAFFILGLTQRLGMPLDRKSTRLNSSHPNPSRMPSSA